MGHAYVAKAAATSPSGYPEGWPPEWDYPGPPWPGGWDDSALPGAPNLTTLHHIYVSCDSSLGASSYNLRGVINLPVGVDSPEYTNAFTWDSPGQDGWISIRFNDPAQMDVAMADKALFLDYPDCKQFIITLEAAGFAVPNDYTIALNMQARTADWYDAPAPDKPANVLFEDDMTSAVLTCDETYHPFASIAVDLDAGTVVLTPPV